MSESKRWPCARCGIEFPDYAYDVERDGLTVTSAYCPACWKRLEDENEAVLKNEPSEVAWRCVTCGRKYARKMFTNKAGRTFDWCFFCRALKVGANPAELKRKGWKGPAQKA